MPFDDCPQTLYSRLFGLRFVPAFAASSGRLRLSVKTKPHTAEAPCAALHVCNRFLRGNFWMKRTVFRAVLPAAAFILMMHSVASRRTSFAETACFRPR